MGLGSWVQLDLPPGCSPGGTVNGDSLAKRRCRPRLPPWLALSSSSTGSLLRSAITAHGGLRCGGGRHSARRCRRVIDVVRLERTYSVFLIQVRETQVFVCARATLDRRIALDLEWVVGF
eukprot:COSAG06_NODE_571_length_14101_cov_12.481682_20_plen_120_part_00